MPYTFHIYLVFLGTSHSFSSPFTILWPSPTDLHIINFAKPRDQLPFTYMELFTSVKLLVGVFSGLGTECPM